MVAQAGWGWRAWLAEFLASRARAASSMHPGLCGGSRSPGERASSLVHGSSPIHDIHHFAWTAVRVCLDKLLLIMFAADCDGTALVLFALVALRYGSLRSHGEANMPRLSLSRVEVEVKVRAGHGTNRHAPRGYGSRVALD